MSQWGQISLSDLAHSVNETMFLFFVLHYFGCQFELCICFMVQSVSKGCFYKCFQFEQEAPQNEYQCKYYC